MEEIFLEEDRGKRERKVIESIGCAAGFGKMEGQFFSETRSSVVLIITKSSELFFP